MTALRALLLGLHLAMVGAASAAPLLCVWLEWKDGRGDRLAGRAGRFLAAASFWLLCLGAVLGFALGALAWRPELRYGLLRLGPRLHSAGAEWIFSVALIGAHYYWWKLAPQPRKWVRFLRALLPLLAGTNLFYHFPALFHVLEDVIAEGAQLVKQGGELAAERMSNGEFRQRMFSAPLAARAAHFWLASFVGAGLLLVWFGRSAIGREQDSGDGRRSVAWGARCALAAAFLQLPTGLWLMVQLPTSVQRSLMGGDGLATGLLVVGIFTSLGLMHFLSSLAMWRSQTLNVSDVRARAGIVAAIGLIVMMLMTGAAQLARPVGGATKVSPLREAEYKEE
jgi:hypothetical protein